jgi:4-hydroxy-2-oxoheptanedioate aldolase
VFFIGPSDLSQSMGHPGNPKAPPVAAAIKDTLARIRKAGRVAGMPAATEAVAEVLGEGCLYIYTHVPKLIGAGAAGYLSAARAAKPG